MKCPACDHPLTPLTVGNVTVDVCEGGCGGIWFDQFELKKVDDEFAGEALLHIARDDLSLIDYNRRRKCPRCPDLVMMRHFFSDRREVEVDECPGCGGFWLDAGELKVIRRECRERGTQATAAKDYFRKFEGFVRTRRGAE